MEKYCPSKKPMWEHDNQCYYHGPETICPICGHIMQECRHAIYKSEHGYSLRELGG